MIKSGLVSITFRQLTPDQIIQMVAQAGLDGIEWGGDVHCPHGDIPTAQAVGSATRAAGLEVAAYGSYYRVGTGMDFQPVLASAIALKAPVIRVWAGNKGSVEYSESAFQQVVEECQNIADAAAQASIAIAFEWHGNTLTDTTASAMRLLHATRHPNIQTYWQPPNDMCYDDRMEGLLQTLPKLRHLHVFSWRKVEDAIVRYPLIECADDWLHYLHTAHQASGDRYAMIEFVQDDSIEQFFADAIVLKDWLHQVQY